MVKCDFLKCKGSNLPIIKCTNCETPFHEACADKAACAITHFDEITSIICAKCAREMLTISQNRSSLMSHLDNSNLLDVSMEIENQQNCPNINNSLMKSIQELLDKQTSSLKSELKNLWKSDIMQLTKDVSDVKTHVESLNKKCISLESRVTSIENKSTNIISNSIGSNSITLMALNMRKQMKEIESRLNNIIIYGSDDSPDSESNNHKDIKVVTNVLKIAKVTTDNITTNRIGKYDIKKKRPIKVTLMSRDDVFKVLKAASSLPKQISVSTDKTKGQRELQKTLWNYANQFNLSCQTKDKIHVKYISDTPTLVNESGNIVTPKNLNLH